MKIARLDTIPRMDNEFQGGEPDAHYLKRQLIVVNDDYDFAGNNATDLTDTDENSVINFNKHGEELVGLYENFKDYMCLRDAIKKSVESLGGGDYSSYAALSAEIRGIAARYVPTKIINNLGFSQLVVDTASINNAMSALENYMGNSSTARNTRYAVMVNYAYNTLGKHDGLVAEDEVLQNNLVYKFVQRGRKRQSEEGANLDGLVDWLESTDNYVSNGLRKNIVDGNLTIKDGTDIDDFIGKCVEIIEDGKY